MGGISLDFFRSRDYFEIVAADDDDDDDNDDDNDDDLLHPRKPH